MDGRFLWRFRHVVSTVQVESPPNDLKETAPGLKELKKELLMGAYQDQFTLLELRGLGLGLGTHRVTVGKH